MKVSDERDDRLHERLVRIEGKLDALREDLRGN
jgi:DNA-binding FrmR family transcriptional regulator